MRKAKAKPAKAGFALSGPPPHHITLTINQGINQMTRRLQRVFCFSGADSPHCQLAYCSNMVNARIITPSTTQWGNNMNLRVLKYGLKPNDCETVTYVTGPDGKVIADTGMARICNSADEANAVTMGNIIMARRVAACLNACDGIETEALEAMPNGFHYLLSDAFKSVIKMPAVAMMMTDQATNDFIEKWNAAPLHGMTITQMQETGHLPPIEIEQIAWLQKANKLHRQVEILYVVDGYTVTVTWDEQPISPDFHGETLREAISKAMASFDLDAEIMRFQGSPRYLLDVQLCVVEAQRNKLLETLKGMRAHIEKISSDHWWIDTPDRGGFDSDALDAVITEIEGVSA